MKRIWLKRTFWTVLILVIALGGLSVWLGPSYVQRSIEDAAGKELGRKVSIASMEFSPLSLQVKINGLTVHAGGEGRLIEIEQIDAALDWQSVTRLMPVIKHLSIKKPQITMARLDANRYDVSDIIERLQARPKGGPGPAFVLNRFAIEGGSIDFDDRTEQTRHTLRELRLRVPFVSNASGQTDLDVTPVFTATINGMALDLSGKLKPFRDPLGASLKLEFSKLDLTRYLGYVPFALGVKLASAMVDGDVDVTLLDSKAKGMTLSAKGEVTLSGLDVRELSDAPMIALSKLKLDIAALEPMARSIRIKSAALEGLDLRVVRRASGLNLAALKAPLVADAKTAETPAPAEVSAASAVPGGGMKFEIAELLMPDAAIAFMDETVTPAVRKLCASLPKVSHSRSKV